MKIAALVLSSLCMAAMTCAALALAGAAIRLMDDAEPEPPRGPVPRGEWNFPIWMRDYQTSGLGI